MSAQPLKKNFSFKNLGWPSPPISFHLSPLYYPQPMSVINSLKNIKKYQQIVWTDRHIRHKKVGEEVEKGGEKRGEEGGDCMRNKEEEMEGGRRRNVRRNGGQGEEIEGEAREGRGKQGLN